MEGDSNGDRVVFVCGAASCGPMSRTAFCVYRRVWVYSFFGAVRQGPKTTSWSFVPPHTTRPRLFFAANVRRHGSSTSPETLSFPLIPLTMTLYIIFSSIRPHSACPPYLCISAYHKTTKHESRNTKHTPRAATNHESCVVNHEPQTLNHELRPWTMNHEP